MTTRWLPGIRIRLKDNQHVTVIDADVLKVDLDELLTETPQKWNVVANLPYNISTEVLFRLYAVHSRLARMTLMLQKEVGDRLAAPPDCSAYGVTTVLLGLWFDISRVVVVHPGSFHPSPKVDSVVLNFIPRTEARAEVGDEEVFRAVVKSAFSMRRKTLVNCLKSAEFAKVVDCNELLEACAIDGRRRGETLSLEEFALLSRYVNRSVTIRIQMTEMMGNGVILLLLACFGLLCTLFIRGRRGASEAVDLQNKIESIEKLLERHERVLREELARSREEAHAGSRRMREEMTGSITLLGDSLSKRMSDIAGLQKNQLELFAAQLKELTSSNEERLDKLRESVDTRLQADSGR